MSFANRRWLLLVVFLLVLAIGVVIAIDFDGDEDKESITYAAQLYGPVPTYPDVRDLAPDAVDLNSPNTFPSLTYGIHTFFWWDETYRKFGLDQINIMQFTHIRQVFAWADVEPLATALDDPLRYRWDEADAMMLDIQDKNIQVIARVSKAPVWAWRPDVAYGEVPFDMERLTAYCRALAERYGEEIAAYQIWNEPNLTREWANTPPSPSAYVELLAACSAAIREADPDAVIISAGLSPTGNRDFSAMPDEEFLWRMYEAGLSEHYDILGLHAPGYRYPPTYDPNHPNPAGCIRWRCFRHIEHMRAIMVANGDGHKQIAITEVGWTTDPRPDSIYHWFARRLDVQADYLRKAYQFAAKNYRPWLGLMVTIYYPNVAWTENDEEFWWAIGTVAPMPYGMDGRPAWPALVQMPKQSSNPLYSHYARNIHLKPIKSNTWTICCSQ